MKPKIGIALGAGAARGWSLIGVLEGLAALDVVPGIVAGTSIGALVGAAFVTGRLAALKARMESFSRFDTASMFDVQLSTGGLIEGRRIEQFLDALGITGTIEELGTRYGAVATDLASGREIWLQSGPIGYAVRASIGIPGVLSPTRHDGGWLVDGGLVDAVPVSLARAMGADVVIAVDLSSGMLGRRFVASEGTTEPVMPADAPQWLKDSVGPILGRVLRRGPEYPSYFEVLANTLNIMQDRISRMRLSGDPPDVLLRPKLGALSWLDFHRAKEAIAAGLACVEAAEAHIRHVC